jgi:hypothetical protein
VQYIRIFWTKASRGHARASRRNAVPRAFDLPADIIASTEPTPVHAVSVEEANSFLPVRTADIWAGDGSRALRIGCACIAFEATGLRLRFEYDESHGGAPARRRFDAQGTSALLSEDVCLLSPGDWARIEWNGRFVDIDTGSWWYELQTVNVALAEDPSPDLFLTANPTIVYSQLADLA